jgi:hypothetical protein
MRGLWLAEVLKENSAPWSWSNSNLVAVITFLLRSIWPHGAANTQNRMSMATWARARSRSEQRILKHQVNGRTDLIHILYYNWSKLCMWWTYFLFPFTAEATLTQFSHPEYGGITFVRNVGTTHATRCHNPGDLSSEQYPPCKPEHLFRSIKVSTV